LFASGFFANDAKKIDLVKGEELVLTSDYAYKGDSTKLACSYPSLAQSVKPGQEILVADGSLVLTVLTVDQADNEVTCRIENNASIGERKNMNLPGVVVDLPTFTEKDVDDIVSRSRSETLRRGRRIIGYSRLSSSLRLPSMCLAWPPTSFATASLARRRT